jgi:enediyne biosynthesis protein E4
LLFGITFEGLTYDSKVMKPLFIIAFSLITFLAVPAQSLFESVSPARSGVSFKNIIIENAAQNALTYENLFNGGGVAVGDINNDGLEDIYFISNMQLNKLYLNQGNFKFKDITQAAGVAGRLGWKSGTSMVDINGDGLLDIYVCYSGKTNADKRRNQFFINQGNLTFIDKAQEMGLDDPSYTTQVAFFDYDRDGDLDAFLLATNVKVIRDLEFKEARTSKHPYAGDKLFRNDNGHFAEVTGQAGILSNALGFGLGVAISDVNRDGWPDIHISNDYAEPDYLYINNQDGTFTNKINSSLQHISHFSMGSDIADVNNDLLPDIFTVDMLPEDNKRQKLLYGPDNYEQFSLMVSEGYHNQFMRNMLHINNGNGTFSEIGQLAGVSNTDWSWGPLFADYDNDGWKDLFVTNGYFRDYTNRDFLKYKGDYYFKKVLAHEKADTLELARSMPSTPVHNYIFKNMGNARFENQSKAWGFSTPTFSNGAAYADLDNDGDLDLIINNQNAEASLYRNLSRQQNPSLHYITLQLKGAGQNAQAIGSSVVIYTKEGRQFFEVMPVRGYQSSVTNRIHSGLNSISLIDSLVVIWPTGKKSKLINVVADQLLVLEETNAQSTYRLADPQTTTLFVKEKSPLVYRHSEYGANDFKRQPLLTTMLSPAGPVMASADVNGDGTMDIFVGGTNENPGRLFVQLSNGIFRMMGNFDFKEDANCSDADARFFDADGDGDQDLYVVSGGYHEYLPDQEVLYDRLYVNDGNGNFMKARNAIPHMSPAKSCVRPIDIDQDGDMDLFVGGRVMPGSYPQTPPSYLLLNDGSGRFTDATEKLLPSLKAGGMITDAAWVDVNKDTHADLIVVGEFMPLRVFVNKQGQSFEEATHQYFKTPQSGWWSKLAVADFDQDGDDDLVVGNFGLNSQFKASEAEPINLVYADFDNNGSIDPILVSYVQHKPYPFAGRDEMLDQLFPLRKKFTTYAPYAEATLTDLFTSAELSQADKLTATELQTVYFENQGTQFIKHTLPIEAQYAPVYSIEVLDFNHDGHLDFILAGNQSAIRIRLGSIDANFGQLYEGNGKGNFRYVPQAESGLSFTGDVKSLKWIKTAAGEFLLAGINNLGIVAYKKK